MDSAFLQPTTFLSGQMIFSVEILWGDFSLSFKPKKRFKTFFSFCFFSFRFFVSSHTLDSRQMQRVNTRRRLHYESLASEGFHSIPGLVETYSGPSGRLSRSTWLVYFFFMFFFLFIKYLFRLLIFRKPLLYSAGKGWKERLGNWNTWETSGLGWVEKSDIWRKLMKVLVCF